MLLLFVGLVLMARLHAGHDARPYLKAFFVIDPLIVLTTFLAAHALIAGGLFSLITIAVTILLGRVFCGWVCPFGTLHDMAGRIFDCFRVGRKQAEHFSPWQRTKYYLLIGFLAMSIFGGHWVCTMDPLVLTYRSMTAAIIPGRSGPSRMAPRPSPSRTMPF